MCRAWLLNEPYLLYVYSLPDRLNEGHTKFIERSIVSRLRGGEPLRQFLLREGWNILHDTVVSCGFLTLKFVKPAVA